MTLESKIKSRCERIFNKARFVVGLGLQLDHMDKGLARTWLKVREDHEQQHGYVHAGVLTTIADHTAGVAATTCIQEDQMVLTVEFKVSFLRPASGEKLYCESKVLRAGKHLAFVESEVYAEKKGAPSGAGRVLVSKASVTLAIVPDTTNA